LQWVDEVEIEIELNPQTEKEEGCFVDEQMIEELLRKNAKLKQ